MQEVKTTSCRKAALTLGAAFHDVADHPLRPGKPAHQPAKQLFEDGPHDAEPLGRPGVEPLVLRALAALRRAADLGSQGPGTPPDNVDIPFCRAGGVGHTI